MEYLKRKKYTLLILVAILAIVIFFFQDYIFLNAPERTVKKFLKSIEEAKFNTALEYIWPPERFKVATSSKLLESLVQTTETQTQIKFYSLKYKTTKRGNQESEVYVNGRMRYQIFGNARDFTFERKFLLIKDNRQWYIKSFD